MQAPNVVKPRPERKPNPAAQRYVPEMGEAQRTASRPQLSEEAIARRAYEKYLARGGEHGKHEADWAAAELELRAESASAELSELRGLQ